MIEELTGIQSAYLNMNTAAHDIEDAMRAWIDADYKECVRILKDQQRQVEAAILKLSGS